MFIFRQNAEKIVLKHLDGLLLKINSYNKKIILLISQLSIKIEKMLKNESNTFSNETESLESLSISQGQTKFNLKFQFFFLFVFILSYRRHL